MRFMKFLGKQVKCLKWISSFTLFSSNLKRHINTDLEKFISGDLELLHSIFSEPKRKNFEIIIVQPGILKSNIPPKIGELLSSCDTYVRTSGNKKLKIVGS